MWHVAVSGENRLRVQEFMVYRDVMPIIILVRQTRRNPLPSHTGWNTESGISETSVRIFQLTEEPAAFIYGLEHRITCFRNVCIFQLTEEPAALIYGLEHRIRCFRNVCTYLPTYGGTRCLHITVETHQLFLKRLYLSSKLDDVTSQKNVILSLHDILFLDGENE